MTSEGDILLFRFPQSDLGVGKLRPALLIERIYGGFDDCLVLQAEWIRSEGAIQSR